MSAPGTESTWCGMRYSLRPVDWMGRQNCLGILCGLQIFDRFEYLLALTFLGQQDGPEHGLAGCSTCAQ